MADNPALDLLATWTRLKQTVVSQQEPLLADLAAELESWQRQNAEALKALGMSDLIQRSNEQLAELKAATEAIAAQVQAAGGSAVLHETLDQLGHQQRALADDLKRLESLEQIVSTLKRLLVKALEVRQLALAVERKQRLERDYEGEASRHRAETELWTRFSDLRDRAQALDERSAQLDARLRNALAIIRESLAPTLGQQAWQTTPPRAWQKLLTSVPVYLRQGTKQLEQLRAELNEVEAIEAAQAPIATAKISQRVALAKQIETRKAALEGVTAISKWSDEMAGYAFWEWPGSSARLPNIKIDVQLEDAGQEPHLLIEELQPVEAYLTSIKSIMDEEDRARRIRHKG